MPQAAHIGDRTRLRASRAAVAIAGLTLALSTAPTQATEVRPQDTRALLQSSQQVVVGRVESTRSYWDANHRRIFTDVKVVVSATLKGAETNTLTLTQLGGELDGMRYAFEGSAEFKAGDEALLFVWRDAHGRAQVNGLAQGKFAIKRDAAGRRVLDRPLPGVAVEPHAAPMAAHPVAEPGSVALDDAVATLQHMLASPPADSTAR